MPKLITICLIFCFCIIKLSYEAEAQQSVQYHANPANVKVLKANGDTMLNPWAGGLESPRFSLIDMNFDGQQDLFLFDPVGNRNLTYINTGNGKYKYEPDYEAYFPKFQFWVFLVDYNRDGKPDIFAYDLGSIKVYKNESSGNALKFSLKEEMLGYWYGENWISNISASEAQLPSFTDADGDGDLDLFIIDGAQIYVHLYKNMSVEIGNPDSLHFGLLENCWGKVTQSTSNHIPELGAKCPDAPPLKKAMHGGFTLLALDVDGDNDLDMLQGDFSYNSLILLRNGKIHNGQQMHPRDTIIEYDTSFPNVATRPKIPGYLTSFYVDVDHDKKRDLIVVPQADQANINQILFYKNQGTDKHPDFRFVQNNFIQEETIDVGRGAAPAFFDYDGDGLQDLIIATAGDFRENLHLADRLVLYKNTGTATAPVYKLIDNDYLEVSKLQKTFLVPAFGDLNGDDKPDLLLGNADGYLIYYRNTTASAGQPATFVLEDQRFKGLDVGNNSAPAIADVNRDSLPDLVIGKQSGFLSYYKNRGTKTNPAFALVTTKFGNVNTTQPGDNGGNSSPVITDLNGDGKWDMLVGSNRGNIYFYMNIERKLLGWFGRDRNNLFNAKLKTYEDKSFGLVTHPAVANLNNDSLPDLVIGNEKGGVYLYVSDSLIPAVTDSVPDTMVDTTVTIIMEKPVHSLPAFSVYPNPVTEALYIHGEAKNVEIQLINILGQTFYRQTFSHFTGSKVIDVSGFAKGIYMLRINENGGRTETIKVLLE